MILIDNDSCIHLAKLGLLDFLLDSLDEEHSSWNVFRLRELLEVAQKKASATEYSEISKFVAKTDPISVLSCQSEFEQIGNISLVDQGEAALFAVCVKEESATVITGDIKSLNAICKSGDVEVINALAGKVLTTEQCLLKILDFIGEEQFLASVSKSGIDHNFFRSLVGESAADIELIIIERIANFSKCIKTLIAYEI